MRLCLQCGFTRYTKRSGVCQKCGHHLTQVDGRLRKVVESLTRSEYAVAFATCETTAVTNISYVGIILCFNQIYDDFVFSSLPKNFRHISDSHHPSLCNTVPLGQVRSRVPELPYQNPCLISNVS